MLSITGDVVRRHPTSNGVMVVRWILLFVLCSAATTFYLTLVPSIITLRSGDALGGTGILIVRLLIHPVIWSAVLTFLQQFLRHRGSMPGMMQLCFLMFPLVYSSVFGRFLLLQVGFGRVDTSAGMIAKRYFDHMAPSAMRHVLSPYDCSWIPPAQSSSSIWPKAATHLGRDSPTARATASG